MMYLMLVNFKFFVMEPILHEAQKNLVILYHFHFQCIFILVTNCTS